MFVVIFLFPMNFLICFGICSTTKLLNYVILSPFIYNSINGIPVELYTSRFTTYAPSFILGK